MNAMFPPIPNRLPGQDLFGFIAKLHIHQIWVLIECCLTNICNNRGDDNAYKWCASKCLGLNLLHPIVENHCHQPWAIVECIALDCPDGGRCWDAYIKCASIKCPPPNILKSITKNHNHQPCAITEFPTLMAGGIPMCVRDKPSLNASFLISSSPCHSPHPIYDWTVIFSLSHLKFHSDVLIAICSFSGLFPSITKLCNKLLLEYVMLGASCQSSQSVAVMLVSCVSCVPGMMDAPGSSRGASHVSSFDSEVPTWNLCWRFCATGVGPSCFFIVWVGHAKYHCR